MLQDAFSFSVGIRYAAYCRNQNGQNDNQYSDVPAYQCRRDGADDAAYFSERSSMRLSVMFGVFKFLSF